MIPESLQTIAACIWIPVVWFVAYIGGLTLLAYVAISLKAMLA